jgi:hypothetical protein
VYQNDIVPIQMLKTRFSLGAVGGDQCSGEAFLALLMPGMTTPGAGLPFIYKFSLRNSLWHRFYGNIELS